ncbi:MAG: hypothetical protein AB1665_04700, partial [Candidatus Thermoplasmatota archaeon]
MKIKLWMLLLILLIFTMALIPKFYLYKHKVADSFIYSHTSIAQSTINEEHVVIRPYQNTANTINRHANAQSTRFVTPLIVAVLGFTTGQPLSDLQFAPICGIMLIFIGFVIAKKMFDSIVLGSAYVLVLSFEPTANLLLNSTYLQGWGFTLYFVTIILVLMWHHRIKQNFPLMTKAKITGLVFLFIGVLLLISEFTYYTTTFYIIILLSFIVLVCAIKILSHVRNKKNRNIFAFITIIFILILVYLFVTYDPAVSFALADSTLFNYFFDVIKNTGIQIGEIFSGNVPPANTAFFVGLIWYIIIFIPIIAFTSFIFYDFLR